MANFMQMAQKAQKFKIKMQDLAERVAQTDVRGESGSGLVTCRVNGKFEIKELKVDPSVIRPFEKDVMEDLIIAALNAAHARVEAFKAEETKKLMEELGLPPNLDLGFPF